jgi:hypothetical protein
MNVKLIADNYAPHEILCFFSKEGFERLTKYQIVPPEFSFLDQAKIYNVSSI